MLPTPVSIEVPPNAKITVEIQNFFLKLINKSVVLCIVSNKIFEHLFSNKFLIKISHQENIEQNIDGLENVILRELKSGSLVNTEVLTLLLPGEKIPINNCENSTLTLVEDFKCSYVAKPHDLGNIKILKETVNSTG